METSRGRACSKCLGEGDTPLLHASAIGDLANSKAGRQSDTICHKIRTAELAAECEELVGSHPIGLAKVSTFHNP